MVKPEWANGIFRCYPCEFSSDPSTLKDGQFEEDQYYEHFEQVVHEHKGNTRCAQCKERTEFKIKSKLPKGKRVPVIFCSKECENQFLGRT